MNKEEAKRRIKAIDNGPLIHCQCPDCVKTLKHIYAIIDQIEPEKVEEKFVDPILEEARKITSHVWADVLDEDLLFFARAIQCETLRAVMDAVNAGDGWDIEKRLDAKIRELEGE